MTNTLHSDADREVTGNVPLLPATEPDATAVAATALPAPSDGRLSLPPPPLTGTEPAPFQPDADVETKDVDDAEVSIGLSSTDVPAISTPAPMPARKWSRVVFIGVTMAVLAAVTTWGWNQQSSAADWKARAVDLEAELESTQTELLSTQSELSATLDLLTETQNELSETQAQLAEIEEQLSVAEEQIEELDAQVATLANTKAQVEDERAQLSTVLASAPPVTTALRACVVSTLEVTDELLAVLKAYPYRSLSGASTMVDDTVTICNDAITKSNDFQATLDALGI